MNNSGQNLLTDFDEGIEEKRRLIEERKFRIKQRRQRAIELVNESYIHNGDQPGSVVSHKEHLRIPGVSPFVYNHEQPSTLAKALPIQMEGSVERFGLSVGAKNTTDNDRKVAIENVLATEYRPHAYDDRQHGSEQIGIPHQDVTFTSELPGMSSNHCDNDTCECREITPSPYTTYLIMVRDFLKDRHDEMTARIKPLPLRERTLYEPSFLTIGQTPRETGRRIQYLSPLDSPFVVRPELPRIHRQYSGLEMTSSCHLDLPGTPMDDRISLDGYGSRMSSTISIDLPFASPTELHKWKAPRIATPYNFKKSTPSPSSSSGASNNTENPSTTSPQPNKFMKFYRRVKRSVHNMRHSLRNLLCGTTVQSLQ